MKNILFIVSLILVTLLSFLYAGESGIDISGDYDCRNYGKMEIVYEKGIFIGFYGFKLGEIRGSVKGDMFRGTWKQDANKKKGKFEFKIIQETKSTSVKKLVGRWKYKGDRRWRKSKWICKKIEGEIPQ